MAPSRGKGKAPAKAFASGSTRGGRRSTRFRAKAGDEDLPDVYQSMLAEANTQASYENGERPLKKRKLVSTMKKADGEQASSLNGPVPPLSQAVAVRDAAPTQASRAPVSSLQTVEDSSESDASDLEFEDVDLDGPAADPTDGIEDLSISVQQESSTKRQTQLRRKPASFAEKAQRLLVHKLHVLCLLAHCTYVNGRCNNAVAHKHLRKLLAPKTISYLNPSSTESQFQRNRSFMDGLQQAMDAFNSEYRPSGAGLLRPQWSIEGEPDKPFESVPIDRSDFITAAQNLEGSQDMGNQLFCAMLRSAGVDARVVCSLQVLPFASVAKPATPKKPVKEIIFAMASYESPSKSSSNVDDTAVTGSSTIGKVPAARRRLGQPSFTSSESVKPPPAPNTRKILKISSISLSPGKRGLRVAISAKMQPTDHMSTPVEYWRPPSRISGERYQSVTTSWV